MELADKKRMARRILGDYERPLREMLDFVDRYPDLEETPAQFQERCAQIALACFWAEQHPDREPIDVKSRSTAELQHLMLNGKH